MAALTTYFPTLIDVTRRMAPGGGIDTIAEILQQSNDMLDDIPWIEGNLPTGHQTTVRTSLPTATFRLLNGGVVPVKTTSGQIVDACAILEARNHIDKDVAMLNGNTAAFRLSEDKGIIESMGQTLASTLIYGDVSVDPEKFNGLASRYFSFSSTTTNAASQMIDAGGTGSDNTSIYLVCWAPDKVFGIYPKGSQAGLQHEDRGVQDIVVDSTTGAYMRALVSWYQWKCGICVRDYRYVVRIANIDTSALLTAGDSSDTSANLLKFMSQAIDKIPPFGNSGRMTFYMNETVRSMLRVKLLPGAGTGYPGYSIGMQDIMRSSIPRGSNTLTFQGIPCRRLDALTAAEARITSGL
jgi:hypothetical protein